MELTATALVAGLLERGHRLTVLAGQGSRFEPSCSEAELWVECGSDQPSWQHRDRLDPVEIPIDGLLPKLWRRALQQQRSFDVIINLAYDWLPIWLTPHAETPLAHLISMGSVSDAMDGVITAVAGSHPDHFAFNTAAQAGDFSLQSPPPPGRQWLRSDPVSIRATRSVPAGVGGADRP